MEDGTEFCGSSGQNNMKQYWLILRSRFLSEMLTGSLLVKKFPVFYGTPSFIPTFTSAHHLSLSGARLIQPMRSYPTSWRSILIVSPHLSLGLPNGFFPFRFPYLNPVYTSPVPHTRYMPRPAHSSRFYHPKNTGWAVQIIKLHIM